MPEFCPRGEKRAFHIRTAQTDDLVTTLQSQTTGRPIFYEALAKLGICLYGQGILHMARLQTTLTNPLGVFIETTSFHPEHKLVVISIERAGRAMRDGIERAFLDNRFGSICLERDHKTLEARDNGDHHLPALDGGLWAFPILVDPMLATGNSAVRALELVAEAYNHSNGYRPVLLTAFATEQGIRRVLEAHPQAIIYTTFLSAQGLDERGYIIDGCGDAGDGYTFHNVRFVVTRLRIIQITLPFLKPPTEQTKNKT